MKLLNLKNRLMENFIVSIVIFLSIMVIRLSSKIKGMTSQPEDQQEKINEIKAQLEDQQQMIDLFVKQSNNLINFMENTDSRLESHSKQLSLIVNNADLLRQMVDVVNARSK